jgi:hypothetical protein
MACLVLCTVPDSLHDPWIICCWAKMLRKNRITVFFYLTFFLPYPSKYLFLPHLFSANFLFSFYLHRIGFLLVDNILAEGTWILKKYESRLWAWLNWSRMESDRELFEHCNKHSVSVKRGIVWPSEKPSTLLDVSFAFRSPYLVFDSFLIWSNTEGTS